MKRLKLTAGVAIKAADQAKPGRKKFHIVAYTGGAMWLEGFDCPVVIDLATLDVSAQRRPILHNHDPAQLVGQSTQIRIEGTELLIDGFFLTTTAVAREVQAIAEDGFDWQASVGADSDHIEQIPEGESVEVNGRSFDGPCYVARHGVLGETSFVVMGADDRTSARIAAKKARASRRAKGIATMTFEEWLKSLGLELATLSDEAKAALQKQFDAEYPAEVEGEGDEEDVEAEDDEEDVEAGRTEAQRRQQRIAAKKKAKAQVKAAKTARTRKVTAAALERAKDHRRIARVEKILAGKPDMIPTALEEGWSPARAELMLLRASRAQAPKPQKGAAGKLQAAVVEAALLLTAGHKEADVGKWYGEQTVNQAMERELRGVSLHFLMDQAIEASGDHYRGNRKSDSFIKAAMRAERSLRASGQFSTLSLSNILENVANKALIASYEAVETIWQEFCAVRNHGDFKIASRYRLDSKGAFRKVAPDGELQHIGLEDTKYTNQLDTFGAIIALNRQMMISDDLDAFLEIPRMLGRLGALTIEEAFVVLLLANTGNFFHADNNNLLTGGASAFGITALTALEQKFRDQVDSNSKPILISPQKLLVGTALKVEADNVYTETTVNETTTTDKAKPAKNPHKGKYRPFTSPYISNTAIRVLDGNDKPTAISGQTSTGFWLFADPAVRAAFAVAFLNGIQTPTIQSDETAFNTLGMQWRAFIDVGVGQEDPTAASKSNGA